MKMIALTPAGYWTSRRNRFDMFVTFVGMIWVFVHIGTMNTLKVKYNILKGMCILCHIFRLRP